MSRYTVVVREVQVIWRIWQPGVGICAQTIKLTAYDEDNIKGIEHDWFNGKKEITRRAVEHWVNMHASDFQDIIDFRADIDPVISEWGEGEDSYIAFSDAMYGED